MEMLWVSLQARIVQCMRTMWRAIGCALVLLGGSIYSVSALGAELEKGLLPFATLDVEHMRLSVIQPQTEKSYYFIRIPLRDAAPHHTLLWKVPTLQDATQAMTLLREGQIKAVLIQTEEITTSSQCRELKEKGRTNPRANEQQQRAADQLAFVDCQLEPYSGKAPTKPCQICDYSMLDVQCSIRVPH
ncbi:MAG TPA: hypothetical protein PLT27_15080 [Nitrospira sp.]|nr:hypothetical protein [Nitrospira sp.]